MDDPDEKGAKVEATLVEFINSAFRNKQQGDGRNFTVLIEQLRLKDHEGLTRWFSALTKCVSLITNGQSQQDKSFRLACLSFDWSTATPNSLLAYSTFLTSVVVANGALLVDVLGALVRPLTMAPLEDGNPLFHQQKILQCERVFEAVHKTLVRISQLVPSCSTYLFPALVGAFPHKGQPTCVQEVYLKNLLKISEAIPTLRDRILTTIIERLILLDVEIAPPIATHGHLLSVTSTGHGGGMAHNGNDDDSVEDDEELMFHVEVDDEVAAEPTTIIVDTVSADAKKESMQYKLDSMMELMFAYLSAVQDQQTSEADVFHSLLRVFETAIMKTHNIRHVQFLLLFFSGFKYAFTEAFLKHLLQKAFDKESSIVEREIASCYVGSYVVRAGQLRSTSVILAFDLLYKWLRAYSEFHVDTTDTLSSEQAKQHSVFYSHAQALMYIFSFRHNILIQYLYQNAHNNDAVQFLELDFLLETRLNPLRFCNSEIVNLFAKVAYHYQILDCYKKLHMNQRSRTDNENKMTTAAASWYEWSVPFNDPFQSYHLPRSTAYIQRDGQLFLDDTKLSHAVREVFERKESGSDDDDDESSSESDYGGARHTGRSGAANDLDLDELSVSLSGMSCSYSS